MAQMHVRPYQQQCLQHVLEQNTIVNMPTGTGKTLVAVMAIDHFRKTGKSIFLVPTRPLVQQQADYVRNNCSEEASVTELHGDKLQNASEAQWEELVKRSDVLVGTAEVFRRALVDVKFLKLSDFSLVVFDECHNAIGNSPMAAILRDAIHRCPLQKAPRILGLTASFVHGSLEDIAKKRRDLEGLLQATIFSPEVDERPMEFESISYELSVHPAMQETIKEKTQVLLRLAEKYDVPLKETKDILRKGDHVFSELGLSAFIYFLRECVAPQVQNLIETSRECRAGRVHQTILESIPQLRQAMRDAADDLKGQLTELPFVTDKASKLLKLMEVLTSQHRQPRVIIFCEQTVLAFPLAHLLQHHLKCRVETCTGVGSMTDGQRKQALEKFRSGDVPILTCTAALEEGLDVNACDVVVRFSHFTTTKSHIQGSGRARAWNAKVFYFDNDPSKELAGAELVDMIAKTRALSLTVSEQAECRTHKDIDGVHPFRTSGDAEISIFNCVKMVYEYVAKTMGQSFRPEENMLVYIEDVICEYPRQTRKRLVSVKIPSPAGFIEINCNMVNEWWRDVSLDDVAEPSRMKNWNGTDKELRRFIYVVAVKLSQLGHLDGKNQPSARAMQENRHACEHWQMAPGVKIKAKYDPDGLRGNGAEDNPKGKLNELMSGAARYTTVQEGNGFRSSVSLPDGRTIEGTTVAMSKKAAEKHVAWLALTGPSHSQCQSLSQPSAASSTSQQDALQETVQSNAIEANTNALESIGDKHGGAANSDSPPDEKDIAPTILDRRIPYDETLEASSHCLPFKDPLKSVLSTLPLQPEDTSKPKLCGERVMDDESDVLATRNSEEVIRNSCTSAAATSTSPRSNAQEIVKSKPTDEPTLVNADQNVGSMQQNAKCALNEMTNGAAKYSTVPDGNGFQSSVLLPGGYVVAGTERACTKKAAEQHAASLALKYLRDSGKGDSQTISSTTGLPCSTHQDESLNLCETQEIENAKGKLNELTNGAVKYEVVSEGSGFRASVIFPDGKVIQGMTSSATKKAAEQQVARLALSNFQTPIQCSTNSQTDSNTDLLNGNCKGALNERFPGQTLVYSTQPHSSGGFRSSVSLPDGRSFSGDESSTNKKASEQLAAKAALLALRAAA